MFYTKIRFCGTIVSPILNPKSKRLIGEVRQTTCNHIVEVDNKEKLSWILEGKGIRLAKQVNVYCEEALW